MASHRRTMAGVAQFGIAIVALLDGMGAARAETASGRYVIVRGRIASHSAAPLRS